MLPEKGKDTQNINTEIDEANKPHRHGYQDQCSGYAIDGGWSSRNDVTQPNEVQPVKHVDGDMNSEVAEELRAAMIKLFTHTHVYTDDHGTACVCNCNCDCLRADYEILMADGSVKLISELSDGEEVMSRNLVTGINEPKKIWHWFCRTSYKMTYIDAGVVVIDSTPSHKWWCERSQSYKEASKFVPGDLIQADNGYHTVKSVESVENTVRVYDFEVKDNHNFWTRLHGTEHFVLSSNCTRGSM